MFLIKIFKEVIPTTILDWNFLFDNIHKRVEISKRVCKTNLLSKIFLVFLARKTDTIILNLFKLKNLLESQEIEYCPSMLTCNFILQTVYMYVFIDFTFFSMTKFFTRSLYVEIFDQTRIIAYLSIYLSIYLFINLSI